MVSFNIETLNSGANLRIIHFGIATLENLLKVAVLKKRLNKTDMEKIG